MSLFKSNIDSLLLKHKKYFDNMFKDIDENILLDDQQRKAITMESNNVLVVAGAGSGKTTTMIAKVVYLIEKLNYKQSEIVVLSFTRKVKEEIEKILYDKFGYNGVSITTFHSLGLRLINASGNNYEKIIDEEGQYTIFSNYIKEILFSNKESFKLFVNAFSNYLFFNEDWKDYDNFNDYHDNVYKKNMLRNRMDLKKYNEYQINKRRNYKKTIKGEYLKSKEEVDIANFLFLNNIDYEYEKKYNNINYHPDFYIKQLENENYIEHFGIDENGHNEMHTKEELNSYLKTLKIKQNFFNEGYNANKFIVTYSKYNQDTNYLNELKKELINRGYNFQFVTQEKTYEVLKNTNKDGYSSSFISRILIPFISLFKQSGYDTNYFDKLISENDNVLKDQLIVLKQFFDYYQKVLEFNKYIDFEDMIYKGYNVLPLLKEKDLGVDYKYLIIDEYQDISSSRFNLIKRISDLFDAKVMAVGDDWQTIFGYSGSRIELFSNFETEMIDAEQVAIENTYRNSQELIDIAGDFILKNPKQIIKRLKSKKHLKDPVEMHVYCDQDKKQIDYNRSVIVEKILEEIYKKDKNSKILFLGRYKKDIYKISNNEKFKLYQKKIVSKKFPKLEIDYLTIHQAKGTGYDYCVLLDLNDDIYGFPSKIEDLPIVKLIKPKICEPIDYPEERRLFYVALTRTKNKVFILVPKLKASVFAKEIKKYINVRIHNIYK